MIQFENPGIFWLLVLFVPLLVFSAWKSYADLSATRMRIATLVRLVGLVLVLTALAKPVLMLENTERAVVFALDVSESVSDDALDRAWSAISEATEELESGERAALVLFGERPRVAIPLVGEAFELDAELEGRVFHRREAERLAERIRELERGSLGAEERAELDDSMAELEVLEAWRAELGVDGTDLEAATRLARGLLPAEARRRVVLHSDGNATRGAIEREVTELRRRGFSVHTAALRREASPEVVAERMLVPAETQIRAPFDVELSIASNYETAAEVRLYRNKFLVATEQVELTVGRNLLEIPKVTLDEGFHEFEAVVVAEGDTVLENNVARGAVAVAGRPKVLVIEREPLQARYLEEALASEEIQVEIRPPAGVPRDLGELLDFDVVVLSDVPADSMSVAQMEDVKRYVREMGGGLVMIGGEQSFGLGGYYRTAIEDALPVRMPIRKNIEKPNLALMLVIDKSGSMGGGKIELAKEAAIASAELLKPNDTFAVIAFDAVADWICRPTDASQLDTISSMVARLEAGGGTNIYPALYEGYQALLQESAKLKHIILLSDGHTNGEGYRELVSHIAADGITLSTVGIGDGADETLLSNMASWAGGEYYFTGDMSSVPQILTRETLRASKSMLVEEPFLPIVNAESDALKGIDPDELPFLLGYVATQPKETATISLISDYGDPVLATWSYGLGKATAFTSDAKARWAGDWIGWESFGKFWGQLVRSVMSTGAHRDLRTQTRVTVEGGVAHLTLDVRGRSGEFRDDIVPEVALLDAVADATELPVTHVAPGLFTAEFPIDEFGDFYRLRVVQWQGDEIADLRALAVTESYSPEYRTPNADEELLARIASETGGLADPSPEDVWTFPGAPARSPRDTWWWWLLAAAILLPFDIGLRRLGG